MRAQQDTSDQNESLKNFYSLHCCTWTRAVERGKRLLQGNPLMVSSAEAAEGQSSRLITVDYSAAAVALVINPTMVGEGVGESHRAVGIRLRSL